MEGIQPRPEGLDRTYERIRAILSDARGRTYRAINTAMVAAYWEIGRAIVEDEQQGQQRITLDGQHYWIDLVFYNRLTRSFVLIDLKVGSLRILHRRFL